MIEWGINALNHGSSLAVFANGDIKYFQKSTEEKLPSEFKKQALNWGSPDKIYWYERPWVKKARQLYAGQYNTVLDLSSSVIPSKYLKAEGFGYAKRKYSHHHGSHAAAGYYTSPFNHAAIVVLDAIGEFECATIWEAKHGEMRKVWSRSYPHSLGLFYSAFTQFVGLTPIKDEHLLQQMAELGKPHKFISYVRSYFEHGDVLKSNTNFHRGVLHWDLNELTSLQEQCDLAAAVQCVFEEQVLAVMKTAKQLTNADCLVYMGGCALNSRANKNCVEPMFKYIWSLPQPGDPSSALGAVLYHKKYRIDWLYGQAKHIEINV